MPKTIAELFPIHQDDWREMPHKNAAEDLRGWNSDSDVFRQMIQMTNPLIIVEVGSWKGRSAINMAMLAPAAKIYCVDTWLGGIDHLLADGDENAIPTGFGYPTLYHVFARNVFNAGLAGRIQPIPNTSSAGAKLLFRHGVIADLIYIDGSHEYEDVRDDITNYFQILRPGGMMFGDDINFPGVAQAVRDSFPTPGVVQILENNFWTVKKA